MPIQPGDHLLHYRIVDKIGEGGMGEVWRARDTTLDRDVAIKLLPGAFTTEAERLARFEREAKVLASLSHPHIAAIHGLHEHEGRRFLAMELVTGEDLAERLARGSIPIDDALSYARKIADALEYAHERGIVHRDLKPANVKVTADGDVKVLDFGLAKAMAADPSTSAPTSTPTMMTVTSAGTAAGLILGTAAYMSPEQARGKPVDKRADNWAFGCVLYEMLAGRRLFEGETVTDVLAAVVTREPDWTSLPAATPASVRRLLARCLDRDPRTRLRDIGEARIVLADPGTAAPAAAPVASTPARRHGRWWIAAAVLALIAGTVLGRYALAPGTPPRQVFEFDITVPGSPIETGSFALSPDGSRLALVVRDEAGNRRLAVRDMNLTEAHVLPGTSHARYPFWSPDGREIGFFAEDQLSRIALDGAAARPVARVPGALGGAWGAGDVILVGNQSGPLLRVPVSGGTPPAPATELDKGVEDRHVWPAFLPDRKRFVFLADAATDEGHRIRLGSLESSSTAILRTGVRSQPVVDPSGRLLLGERGQLLAYGFDLDSGRLREESVLVATRVFPGGAEHHLPVTASVGGMVGFQTGSWDSSLVFLDTAGRVTRTVGAPERYGNVVVSPDRKRVAFEIYADTAERLVWVQDLERGVRTPVSHRGHLADSAVWSPDGETVYFDANVSGRWEIYRKAVAGGGDPEGLGSPTEGDLTVFDVSRDGRWLLAAAAMGDNRNDLYLRSLDGADGAWTAWADGPADEASGGFSPDTQWIAYTTDASGRAEVYVAPLEGGPAARRWQISSGGGFEPRFSADGKTIFYRSAAFDWMAVDVRLADDKVEAGTPNALFSMPVIELPFIRNLMDVLPDGSGFVTLHPASTDVLSIRVRTGS